MKLLQKQNDERWKRESTTKVEEEQFAMRCRCCSALMCMSTDVRRIKESQYAVLSRQFDSGIAAVRRERRELRSGVGKIMCQSCGQDLGNVGHFQGAQFPMIKLRSFVLEDVYGHHFVIAKWKNSPFLVAALSQTELQERIVSSIQLLPSFKQSALKQQEQALRTQKQATMSFSEGSKTSDSTKCKKHYCNCISYCTSTYDVSFVLALRYCLKYAD